MAGMTTVVDALTGAQQTFGAAQLTQQQGSSRLVQLVDAPSWAQQTFGAAQLGDQRRSKRLVHIASQVARDPGASLPSQLGGRWGELKAAYRLLHEPDVTHEALSQPHWQQTREWAKKQQEPVLLVHDDTELDYGYDPAVSGLGPIGNGSHAGFFVHSVLAVVPQASGERVLGLAYQKPWVRQRAPRTTKGKKQSRRQRAHRERESGHWPHAVEEVGPAPEGGRWVHVGDRYADMYDFLLACLSSGCDVLVRAEQNRCLQVWQEEEEEASQQLDHLIDRMKSWSVQGAREQEVPSEHERRARRARLCISWGQVHIQPPDGHAGLGKQAPVLRLWAIHVWEPDPPVCKEGQRPRVRREKHGAARKRRQRRQQQAEPGQEDERMEPLEWFLLTSVPVEREADAWQRVDWYACRWGVEDFHKGLKTGCHMQERHLRDEASLERLLGLLAPIAVRLLQLRELVQEIPEQPVLSWVPREEAQLIAWQRQVPVEHLTVRGFLREVAHMGGFLGRKSDGQPGWQTLWKGWMRLHWQAEGIRLANQHAPPKRCG